MATSKDASKALKKAVNGIIDDIRSQDGKRQFRGTSKVSKLLRAPQRELEWESDQVIDAVVKTGAVSRLAQFLERYDDHKLQSEAANALANISAGTSQNTCAVINAGVVPIATRLLASASSDLQDHAAWLLANIACESCACVLEAGALPPLLKLLDEQKQDTPSEISLVKTGTWLLSNLCQYTEDFDKVKDCLPRLAVLLKSNDEAVLKDGCWGLMYMCRLSIDAVVRSGACEPLTKLLMHSSDDVCCVALEALSAIFSNGTTAHKSQISQYNVFPRLRYLLHSKRERTREITCSTLANVVRNEAALLPELLRSGVVSSLLRIIGRHAATREGWLTWREAVRTACCIVVSARLKAPDIIKHLVGHGLIMYINETVSDASYTSLELCIDPTLRLVEQLIEAGETANYEKEMLSSENELPNTIPHQNRYKQQIIDTGLAASLQHSNLLRIWRSGYDERSATAPPLPEHLERLCLRVEDLLKTSQQEQYTSIPSLRQLVIETLRQNVTYHKLHTLDIAAEDKALVVGLEAREMGFFPTRDVCSCVIEDTLAIKDVGDKHFIAGRYSEAAVAYTDALLTIESAAIEALTLILLLNRSAAYMKMDLFDHVIADCSKGIEISDNHIQCLQRRAIAYERSGLLRNALDDYYMLRGEEADMSRRKLKAELGLQQNTTTSTTHKNYNHHHNHHHNHTRNHNHNHNINNATNYNNRHHQNNTNIHNPHHTHNNTHNINNNINNNNNNHNNHNNNNNNDNNNHTDNNNSINNNHNHNNNNNNHHHHNNNYNNGGVGSSNLNHNNTVALQEPNDGECNHHDHNHTHSSSCRHGHSHGGHNHSNTNHNNHAHGHGNNSGADGGHSHGEYIVGTAADGSIHTFIPDNDGVPASEAFSYSTFKLLREVSRAYLLKS